MNASACTETRADASLDGLMDGFVERINAEPQLRGVLRGWNPEFRIQGRDSGASFRIEVDGEKVRKTRCADPIPEHALLLLADEPVLRAVFCGELSPLSAYTDGLLAIDGSPKDQRKLDAIALVLWGA